MEEQLLAYLAEKLEEDIEREKAAIARGAARDFAEYRYLAGVINGYARAKNHILETAERYQHDDD